MLSDCKIIPGNTSHDAYAKQPEGITRGHPDFVMSRSELVEFFINANKWRVGVRKESTEAMTWGTLMDCYLTCPDRFDDLFAVKPDTYPAADGTDKKWSGNANFCKDWVEEHSDREIITSDDVLEAQKAIAAIKASPDVAEVFAISQKQVMVAGIWTDKATGIRIPLRALLDLVPDAKHAEWGKDIGDSKTARNGNPAKWDRVCDDGGYDFQAALYLDMFNAATGEGRDGFIYCIQENEPPYHVTTPIPALSPEFIIFGRMKYMSALAYYAECLRRNVWPGYAPAGFIIGKKQMIGPENLWAFKQHNDTGMLAERFGEARIAPPEKPKFVSETPT